MKCPYFVDWRDTGTASQCLGVVVPFEPTPIDQRDFCLSGRHQHCPSHRPTGYDLSLEIHREVTRAIG